MLVDNSLNLLNFPSFAQLQSYFMPPELPSGRISEWVKTLSPKVSLIRSKSWLEEKMYSLATRNTALIAAGTILCAGAYVGARYLQGKFKELQQKNAALIDDLIVIDFLNSVKEQEQRISDKKIDRLVDDVNLLKMNLKSSKKATADAQKTNVKKNKNLRISLGKCLILRQERDDLAQKLKRAEQTNVELGLKVEAFSSQILSANQDEGRIVELLGENKRLKCESEELRQKTSRAKSMLGQKESALRQKEASLSIRDSQLIEEADAARLRLLDQYHVIQQERTQIEVEKEYARQLELEAEATYHRLKREITQDHINRLNQMFSGQSSSSS